MTIPWTRMPRQASAGAMGLLPKSEIRNSKSETNPKHQIRNPKQAAPSCLVSNFVFRVCFGFRYSNFGFSGLLAALLFCLTGCGGPRAEPELVWGKRGVLDGELVKPRAIAIDSQDRLYLVDWTARIQEFDLDGHLLHKPWTPPDFRNGRPSGLSIHPDGNLIVSDSHYSCIRIYSPQGELLRTIGGKSGTAPGELSYISDTVCDASGNFYVAEFGENQRISKLDPDGKFLMCWGEPGAEPGQFAKLRALALGPDGNLYAADACNHRIQVFTTDGKLVRIVGSPGSGPGELSYPYDLAFPPGDAKFLYVMEYGNQRVQKFTLEGQSLGTWGGPGRDPGRLSSPWALAVDRHGRVHVVDSENHRIQRIRF